MRSQHGFVACLTKRGIGLGWGAANLVLPGREELLRYWRRLYPVSQYGAAGSEDVSIHSPEFEISVEWDQLRGLEAVDPWPSLRVDWGAGERIVEPRGGVLGDAPSDRDKREFGDMVEVLFDKLPDYFEDHRSAVQQNVIMRGWLKYPKVGWEREEALPEDDPEVHGAGPFRGARPRKRVLATRRAPSHAGSLLMWLASSPDRPWKHTPKRVRLTKERVFVEVFSGRVSSLPRSALRAGAGAEDRVYTFGRGAQLILTDADGCPVVQAFDQQLRDRDVLLEPG